MFQPLFGYSLQKGAKFIAIADLVICILYVLAHFAGGGYLYNQRYEKYNEDLAEVLNSNQSGLIENANTSGVDTGPTPKPSISIEDYNKLISEKLPSVEIFIVVGICVLLFTIAHICLEIWLCRLLLKAAAHKDGSACKHWFWCRLTVTILFSLYSLVGLMTVETDILDWICVFFNIYRIYSLFVIYAFKKEISASVSIVKPR